MVPAARRGFLLPEGEPWDFDAEHVAVGQSWNGLIEIKLEEPKQELPLWKAWLPYLLIAVLLVISRLPVLGVGDLLKSISIPRDAGNHGERVWINRRHLAGSIAVSSRIDLHCRLRIDGCFASDEWRGDRAGRETIEHG